jgi:hypothetical protein
MRTTSISNTSQAGKLLTIQRLKLHTPTEGAGELLIDFNRRLAECGLVAAGPDSSQAGWTAHIIEQTASNALIRPLSEYVGPPQRALW